MILGVGSRGLELRWEDVFLMMMFFEVIPKSNLIARIPKVSRSFIIFILLFISILTLNIVRLNAPNLLMYTLVYFKLLLWMVTLGLFFQKNKDSISEEKLTEQIVLICKVLIVAAILGGIYQYIMHDAAFKKMAQATIGLTNWNAISGGSLKYSDRPNWFFESEPLGTGTIYLVWTILAVYGTKKRPWAWIGIGGLNILLSLSKTTIFTYVFFLIFYIISGGKRQRKLRVDFVFIFIVMEIVSILYVASRQFREFLFSIIMWGLRSLGSLAFGMDSEVALIISQISATASFDIRRLVMNLYGDTIYSSFSNILLGSFGYQFFDNNFLFLIGVTGYLGLFLFLITQISVFINFKRYSLEKINYWSDLRYPMLVIYFFTFVFLGFTGEVLRQLRTISFLFPALLIVENVVLYGKKEREDV